MRIVRAGRGFGVVLHAEDRLVAVAEAFQRLVVQVDVGDLDVAQVERIGIDREAVIVRGDLDLLVSSLRTGWLAPRCPNFSL